MRVQEIELRDRFGLAEPDEGADILHPVSAGMSGEMAMNRERVALNREHPDELAQMVDDALRDWQKTGEAFTNPVLTLAQECDSFDDFLKRLPELQETLNADDLPCNWRRCALRPCAGGHRSCVKPSSRKRRWRG